MSCCGQNSQFIIPTMRQAIHGTVAITKIVIGMRATEEIIKQRRDICRECKFATKKESLKNNPSKGLTGTSQCVKCACIIKFKTIAKNEQCPLGFWEGKWE